MATVKLCFVAHISAVSVYCRGTTGISHLKIVTELIDCLKFCKTGEHEVFWSGVKEHTMQNCVIGRKLIYSNADCSFSFMKT